ncbi:MAG: hypothetical protein COZ05_15950, partial [Armatimonadetes bacterium CG_4_10_14_3_um_filter_59_10]
MHFQPSLRKISSYGTQTAPRNAHFQSNTISYHLPIAQWHRPDINGTSRLFKDQSRLLNGIPPVISGVSLLVNATSRLAHWLSQTVNARCPVPLDGYPQPDLTVTFTV